MPDEAMPYVPTSHLAAFALGAAGGATVLAFSGLVLYGAVKVIDLYERVLDDRSKG